MVLPDLNFSPPEEDIVPEEEGDENAGVQQMPRRRMWLTDEQRYAAYMSMQTLFMSRGEKFERDDKTKVAAIFGAQVRVIQRIWETAMKQKELGLDVDVSNKRKGRCGRKPMDDILSLIPTIPLNRRSTVRSLARALGISPTTLYKKFKLGKVRRHSSSLKPALTEKNKRDRVEFCISMLDGTTLGDAGPSFTSMQNIVHIDEKWFNMTKRKRNYYLLPEEEDPERTVQNKNSIGKVMFLTAVARPRYDADGNVTFSGKIGVWPFVKVTAAAKRSKNRERGTLETKTIIVNRDVMREYIIQKVVPAIKAVWPTDDDGQTIFIQQDNARTHILPNDPAFAEAVAQTDLDIRLMYQPANSPDMNALDLGFFGSIQSLTDCRAPKTLKDLIEGVQEEFDGYEIENLNKVFITLQTCMVEVLDNGGGNGYKIPHLNKKRLQRLGLLPSRISVPPAIYAKAIEMLGLGIH